MAWYKRRLKKRFYDNELAEMARIATLLDAKSMQFGNPITSASLTPNQLGQATFAAAPVNFLPNLPANTRTLLISFSSAYLGTVIVTGSSTGIIYYSAIPYLGSSGGAGTLVMVPVNSILDSTVNIHGGALFTGTVTVFGDSEIYQENLFYNGEPVAAETAALGTTVLANGPVRLLTALIDIGSATAGVVRVQSSGVVGKIFLHANNAVAGVDDVNVNATFPQPYILPAGDGIETLITTSGVGGASWAYP